MFGRAVRVLRTSLSAKTWRVPVITFSVLKLSRFCWCSPSLMIACIWKSLVSVPQPRKRVIPTFPLTPLHPPTKQFSWPLVATKRLLSVHLVMSLVLITWKILLSLAHLRLHQSLLSLADEVGG